MDIDPIFNGVLDILSKSSDLSSLERHSFEVSSLERHSFDPQDSRISS